MNNLDSVKIGIDISSMSRNKIALWLEYLVSVLDIPTVEIDFYYSLAPIEGGCAENYPIKYSGPVTPYFAGWIPNIDTPLTTVIGLGYDQVKSVGICEYLESTNVYAYLPQFLDVNQNKLIEKENTTLFDWIKRMSVTGGVYHYNVNEPYSTFLNLESLTYSLECYVFIHFGPKIFALISMLTSLIYYPKVSIWRVSSGEDDKAVDREPSGVVVGLRATLTNKNR